MRGRNVVSIYNRLHAIVKEFYPAGDRDPLRNAQVILVLVGSTMSAPPEPGDGVVAPAAAELSLATTDSGAYMIADVPMSPFKLFIGELKTVVPGIIQDLMRDEEDRSKVQPFDNVQWCYNDDVWEWDIVRELDQRKLWEVLAWDIVWENKFVDKIRPRGADAQLHQRDLKVLLIIIYGATARLCEIQFLLTYSKQYLVNIIIIVCNIMYLA